MAQPFEFATAGQIIFGAGKVKQLAGLARKWGRRALVVKGADTPRTQALVEDLQAQGLDVQILEVHGEPSVTYIAGALPAARSVELLIGLGGGSAMDSAKALAALAANPGEISDYLEVVGKNQPLSLPSLPCIAVPTTAGTGAEVTRNAVLSVPEQGIKVSLRSAGMLPRLALVDPELTYGLPAEVTAFSGLDALTQLIEPFFSIAANPLTDGLCREGIPRIAKALPLAFGLDDPAARQEMALAALFGGLALANAKLGAVHGLAGVIGGMYGAAHGAVCAALLPHVLDANLHALLMRQPANPVLTRYAELALLLTGHPDASAKQGIRFLRSLTEQLRVPGLAAQGVRAADFDAIIIKAQKASSMQGNPLPLTDAELGLILEKAL